MRPLHINQKRFREYVCTHQVCVAVAQVAVRSVGHLGQEHMIDPVGTAKMPDGGVSARLHDLYSGRVVLHPQELGLAAQQKLP